jgi:enoyl-CoA hydratase
VSYETLIVETLGRVQRITLNRPERLNALNKTLLAELFAAFDAAEGDQDVGCILLRGAGRAFCAGHDLAESSGAPPKSPQEDLYRLKHAEGRLADTFHLHTPVVAQLHGYCLGEGTSLALNCDILIAADDLMIGMPPVRWGGSPTTHMWTYHAGPQWAKYLLLTGDSIDGRTAASIGLVMKSVPPDDLEAAAFAIAESIAKVPNDLTTTNKLIVNKALDLMGRSTLQQLAQEADVFGHYSPDAKEFLQIVRTRGLQAALKWQEARFGPTAAAPLET